jgi:hypothetical protein
MSPQLITDQDRENYGSELIDMTQRAAMEALSPELQRLHAENQALRQMAARSQNSEIQRTLDQSVPGWRATYADERFSRWLSTPDDYSGAVRSQLLRDAVAKGDAGRVAAIYKGFRQEEGHQAPAHQPRAAQSRQTAPSSAILTRPQIAALYERHRKGEFNDDQWAQIEPAIFNAANQGRVVGAIGPDGMELSRWKR